MKLFLSALILTLPAVSSVRGQSWVSTVFPSPNSSSALLDTHIEVTFSEAIDPASLSDSTVTIQGSLAGRRSGSIDYDADSFTATILPSTSFLAGDVVHVTLTSGIRNAAGAAMPGSYSFRFSVKGSAGSGSFDLEEHLAMPPSVVHINLHDFDADQWPDLTLVDDYPNNSWMIAYSNPRGGSINWTTSAYVGWTPSYHAFGDLNGNGRTELVATRLDHPHAPLFVWGGENFLDAGERYVGDGVRHIVVNDVDADGWQDIVFSNPAIDSIVVLFNDGASIPSDASRIHAFHPLMTIVADMDGDGNPDLVATDPAGVRIFINGGARTFSETTHVALGVGPEALVVGDFDVDGYADFAALDTQSDRVIVASNDGTGRSFLLSSFGVGSQPSALVALDFDSDNLTDIATSNYGSNSVTVLMNAGGRNFNARRGIPLQYGPTDIDGADWDQDGDIDLLVVSKGSNFLSILLNKPPVPKIAVIPDSLDFHGSPVDSAVSLPIWVYNTGGSVNVIARARIGGDAAFTFHPDSVVVPPDDSAAFWVNFLPAMSRNYAATLSLQHNDTGTGEIAIPITGYGLPVESVQPLHQSIWNPDPDTLTITFTEPMVPSSVSAASLFVVGTRSGRHLPESISWSGDGRTVTIGLHGAFLNEERVTVTITTGVLTAVGPAIVRPFSWSFKVRSGAGTAVFGHAVVIAPDRDNFADVQAGDFRPDGLVDLAVAASSMVYHFTGQEDGWVGSGGAGGQGAASFADLAGMGGVGMMSGNWTEAFYTYWSYDSATSLPMQGFVTLGPLSDFPNGSVGIDYDLDGDLDAAFCLVWGHALQVYRNDGNLEFTTLPSQLLDGGPVALSSGDFDGDGYPDILASMYGRQEVAFCRNNGDGTFEVVARPFVGTSPLASALADFNGDGRVDAAVGAFEGKSISVLLNTGNFTFQRIEIDPGGRPRGLTAADFNGDGLIDLAAAIESRGAVVIWENRGVAGFAKILDRTLGSVVGGVDAVDFRRDGSADLIVSVDQTVVLLENKRPEPDIEVPQRSVTFPNVAVDGANIKSFSISNTGGRGDLEITDIQTTHETFSVSPTSLSLPIGTSASVQLTFSPDQPRIYSDSILITSNDPDTPVMVVPVYGSGLPVVETDPGPLAAVDPHSDTVSIALVANIDPSTLDSGIVVRSPWRAFRPDDWSHSYDYINRVITLTGFQTAKPGEEITVSLTPGIRLEILGSPLSPFEWSFQSRPPSGTAGFEMGQLVTGINVSSPSLADLDGDGDLDIAYACFQSNEVFVFLNSGTGTFSLHQRVWPLIDCISTTVADYDSDGDMDIAVGHQAWTNAFTLLRNDGTGTFTSDDPLYFQDPLFKIVAGDAEGDGDVDVFVDYSGRGIIMENDGTGTFTPYLTDIIGGTPVVADFNNDGLLDVATADYYNGDVRVYSSEGAGVYQLRYQGKPGRAVQPIVTGDFDGDGWCDLAVGGYTNDLRYGVMILRNDHNLGFSMLASPSVSNHPMGLAAGDLDGDGDLDLITANYDTTASVIVHSEFGFQTTGTYPVGAEPSSVIIGDLDGDGDLDAGIGAYVGGSIRILLNGLPVHVEDEIQIPRIFSLSQNYPNPFNPTTSIEFTIPVRTRVRLEVFNILGERVAVLVDEEKLPGQYSTEWRAGVPSGMYLYRIKAGEFMAVKKMVLIR